VYTYKSELELPLRSITGWPGTIKLPEAEAQGTSLHPGHSSSRVSFILGIRLPGYPSSWAFVFQGILVSETSK
jgi:hypothetical protein